MRFMKKYTLSIFLILCIFGSFKNPTLLNAKTVDECYASFPKPNGIFSVMLCIATEAAEKNDISLCPKEHEKYSVCIIRAASIAHNTSWCEELKTQEGDDTLYFECLSQVAVVTKDINACFSLPQDARMLPQECISGIAGFKKDRTICSLIDDGTREDHVLQFFLETDRSSSLRESCISLATIDKNRFPIIALYSLSLLILALIPFRYIARLFQDLRRTRALGIYAAYIATLSFLLVGINILSYSYSVSLLNPLVSGVLVMLVSSVPIFFFIKCLFEDRQKKKRQVFLEYLYIPLSIVCIYGIFFLSPLSAIFGSLLEHRSEHILDGIVIGMAIFGPITIPWIWLLFVSHKVMKTHTDIVLRKKIRFMVYVTTAVVLLLVTSIILYGIYQLAHIPS